MPSRGPSHGAGFSSASSWTVVSAAMGVLLMLAVATLPRALILPAISSLMVVAGILIAAVSYVTSSRTAQQDLRGWDIAGLLLFVGIAGAFIANDQEAFQAFAQLEHRMLAGLSR